LLKGIVNRINFIIIHFLWAVAGSDRKIHLVRRETLASQVDERRWGFKDTKCFNLTLFLKKNWRVVCGDGLWHRIVKVKYLKKKELYGWIREGTPDPKAVLQS